MIDAVVHALSFDSKSGDECIVATNFENPPESGIFKVVRIPRATLGATDTVTLALQDEDLEPNSSSLLLLDCDAIYHCDVVSMCRSFESCPKVRAAVLCFEESAEQQKEAAKYSYVYSSGDGERVTRIAEKERVGPYANTGAYWFASETEFLERAKEVLGNNKFQNGEAYVSCVLREYIAMEAHVVSIVIDESDYSNVGVPTCLENHLKAKCGSAFLFDLDGTLVDTTKAYVKAWNELLGPKGAFVDEEFFLSHISGKSDKQVSNAFNIVISSTEKDEHFVRHIALTKEIPGAVDFVRQCQTHGPVCVVTNSNKTAAEALLKHVGLEGLLLISAEDCKNGKPDAEPYITAVRRLGVSIANSIVFEDSRTGMVAGRASGCKYVVSVSTNLAGSDVYIENYLGENPKNLLERLNSVSHLSEELSNELGQRSIVYPVRASGGYISEILSATSGSRRLVVKQENSDHGVLSVVSEHLDLHNTECVFYEDFAHVMPVRVPTCYCILPHSRAIIMEDLRKFDRAPQFDLESGLKVVKTMATMHSHFRGAPLGRLNKRNTYMKDHIERHYSTFRKRWCSTLGEEVLQSFDHAVENFGEAEKLLCQEPQTLLHGDLKFPNLFWDKHANGGEPILIDWQYARPGQGIEDIVFLLVESCEISEFESLAKVLIDSYFDDCQKRDDITVPKHERTVLISSALAGFPLFVAVWFGCIDASKLTEPNFPFLYILRLANAFKHLYDINWLCTRRALSG